MREKIETDMVLAQNVIGNAVVNFKSYKKMDKKRGSFLLIIAISAILLIAFGSKSNLKIEDYKVESNVATEVMVADNNSLKNEALFVPVTNGQNTEANTSIILDGKKITVNGSGVLVSGSIATITSSGTFSISGKLDDGQIIVDSDAKETVNLILKGVDIKCSNSSPIYVAQADKVIITIAEGTENFISDGVIYTFSDPNINEPNAALFSKDDLTINGSGVLNVEGNFNDGIAGKDKIKIESGTLVVSSKDDGIRSKDHLNIKGGKITVTANGDGFKSDNEKDSSKGNITIVDGIINITAGGDAIQAASNILIKGGDFVLNSGVGSVQNNGTYTSGKGLNSGDSLTISGKTFKINSKDDAIHSNNVLTIESGSFTIETNDDGIHADTLLVVNGGNINILNSYEGVESQVVRINGGEIVLNSSDDGFSIASGGGRQMGWGRGGGGSGGNNFLYITGGYIYINSNGDGVDSNGSVEMTDGTLIISGPTASMNGALDYDGSFKISGGLIVAAGSSGMAQIPGTSSTQNSVLVYLDSEQKGGTTFNLQTSKGEDIISFIPQKLYQSVAISSPKIKNGTEYNVYVGGSSSGKIKNGLYQGGKYLPGMKLASFTVNNVSTTVGSGGRGGGFGGRPMRR